ncbi:beta-lactamase family protein [Clostridium gasigenes]|uniref:serine hydrolase domain-containing protein n=1 Tax=Clostridium gasigenes TaxID=94869 RepID=UPI00143854D5|nr:serine hydrolase domain-containing protein [Clostridium gasigenes]NKF05865.1 beta-lactamase family protein [Clostridium gasigenes]QSW19404.1 beta-lactamase family protein [Clostridium gasigenes]
MVKVNRKIVKWIAIIISTSSIGAGIFFCVVSYKMSLIPSMTFEEMLSYTTKNNDEARITVGTIKDGKMEFVVYGNDGEVLPSEEHEYEIGSLTKTFTTSLLCKAIDGGNVTLDSSIDDYLNLAPKEYYPTLRRLVTHTSGFKGYYFDGQMISNFFKGEKNDFYGISEEKLNKKISKVALKNKDYDFNYSNFGLSVVGSVLAEIYDTDYTTLMNSFINNDLGLQNTKISDGTGAIEEYWHWNANDGYLPAGGLVSTITDMMKYVQLQISEEKQYLSQAHKTIENINATSKRNEKMGIRMDAAGIGWMIDRENNIVWHNGGTSNFNSYIAFDKEKQVGVVILSNLSPSYRIPATVMGVKLMKSLQGEV